MAIRSNSNPRPLVLPPELQDILARNGMTAQVVGSSNGFALIVQGHDSPVLTYTINQNQLKALTDWGSNTANRKAYNTFASIVATDFDMPKDFVHARNANGRVAMGLHGYRIGVGEYGRVAPPYGFHGHNPYHHPHHMMGWGFLGWTPRQQDGWHMRRIGGDLYYPGAPMVPNRPDGRMKPGELQNGAYGFYYKGHTTAPVVVNQQDVLDQLLTVITPIEQPQRSQEPAKPYKDLITSDVYFSNEKWQEVLASHGIIVDAENKTMIIQSDALPADLKYDLTDEEVKALTSNSIKDYPIAKRIEVINEVIKDDFAVKVTMDMLNSDKRITITLHPEVMQDLEQQLGRQEQYYQQVDNGQGQQYQQYQQIQGYDVVDEVTLRDPLPKGGVLMHGDDLLYMNPDKGWFREGNHGREVYVGDIRVEPTAEAGKYKISAVIDGEVVTHEMKQKDYDKFMAVDDFHRMKMFSKIFKEVDMKDRYQVGVGTKIAAGLAAGLTVTTGIMMATRCHPPVFMDRPPMEPRVFFKPGVDTPADVAARQFDAMMNAPVDRGPGMGR